MNSFRWSLKRSLEHAGQGREANCSATQQILSSLPCIDRPFASPSTRLIIIVRALSQNNAESELSLLTIFPLGVRIAASERELELENFNMIFLTAEDWPAVRSDCRVGPA